MDTQSLIMLADRQEDCHWSFL